MMTKLGRLWDWLAPGLINLDPMGAMAYHRAVAMNETSLDRSARSQRHELVFGVKTGRAGIELVELPRPAPAGQ